MAGTSPVIVISLAYLRKREDGIELLKTEHRKFLKSRKGWLEAGEVLPNASLGEGKLNPYDLITDYLILITLSTSCEPCFDALDMLQPMLAQHGPFNILMLVDCDEKDFEIFRAEFGHLAALCHVSADELQKGISTNAFPWAYGINKVGQIVTSSVCGSREEFLGVIGPFHRYLHIPK